MALLQISEPGASSAPHQHRLAIGIDLGTTHSLVASVRSGRAEILLDESGRAMLPSVVQYSDNNIVVGQAALDAATEDPLNSIQSVKRLMGRASDELKTLSGRLPYQMSEAEAGVPLIHTAAGEVSAIQVSAEILKQLRLRAEDTLGGELLGAVITVPAYFDDAQRQATKDAARLAGIKILRLLNEPTAAAVAYGLDHDAEGIHAIYDLGGGTFDISILRLQRGVFEVMATGGDSALGGDDLDRAIAAWIVQQMQRTSALDAVTERHLTQAARQAKEALSTQVEVEISIHLPAGESWRGTLDQPTLRSLIEPLIRKTLSSCRRTVRDAGIRIDDIHDVVMVGGSTRSPDVREWVGEFFKTEPLVSIDPDQVVAIGAAIQADILVGNKPDSDMLLLDVTPLSLGLETMGGLVERIIPRNTTIPVARAQQFTTYKDGQTGLSLQVVQGERDLVSDCRSLARFSLKGFPAMVAGAARIQVKFEVDADGLLHVSAEELASGVSASIEVKPSYGLGDGEIERMLRDSIDHAGEDMQARKLRGQQVEADRVIEALQAALKADADQLLNPQELELLQKELQNLLEVRANGDAEAIQAASKQLEKAAGFYVQRRMDNSVRKAMAGHKLDEFEN
ncbi:MAG: Fe-S protein assembly chaperone HscA [gamma proteobacterium symbiont of Bathyaustriella thionipta]|nr:Fe-S protein assembly chaperone HscA [gamma proteobacterium symbiont of Bathyaustriella thionipta]